MFADTHCHLDFVGLASQLNSIQRAMDNQRIGMLVVPSVERSNWSKVIDIAKKDSRFFFGLGLHPYFIETHEIEDISMLADEINNLKRQKSKKLVAIGEIGLDFTRPDTKKQIDLFEAQLALAEEYELPVIIHTRKANAETLGSIKKFNLVGGVVHAFSGSYELMMGYIDQGLKIGVGPVITWPASSKTRKSVTRAPIESLVLETDAPDMSVSRVEPGSGSPLNVCDVFETLKNIRSETGQTLEDALWYNSRQLFIMT